MSRSRPTFLETAISTALTWAERSEDPYRKVGACVLDKEGRVLSVGYNGLLPKMSVDRAFWKDREYRRKFIVHAETNALSLINKKDNPYIIAVSMLPCSDCAKNIACHGIKTVVYNEEYDRDQDSKKIFKFYNIKLIKI